MPLCFGEGGSIKDRSQEGGGTTGSKFRNPGAQL